MYLHSWISQTILSKDVQKCSSISLTCPTGLSILQMPRDEMSRDEELLGNLVGRLSKALESLCTIVVVVVVVVVVELKVW